MKINTQINPTNKEGNAITLSNTGTGETPYAIIEPGYYTAIITGVNLHRFQSKAGVWYQQVIPAIALLNPQGTQINRQSFTIGAVRAAAEGADMKNPATEVELYAPDPTKSPLWGGKAGALGLLISCGLLTPGEAPGSYDVDVDPRTIAGFIVKVRIVTETYTRRDGGVGSKNAVEAFYGADDKTISDLSESGLEPFVNVVTENIRQVFTSEAAYQSFLLAQASDFDADVWG